MIMRFKVAKFIFLVILVELLALYYSWKFISKFGTNPTTVNITYSNKQIITKSGSKHISKIVTVILRNFELQENDVTLTVESILNVFPSIQILIICDGYPYPPLDLVFSNSTIKNIKLINLGLNLNTSYKDNYPLFQIKTKYVLFIPDSIRITSRQPIATMLNELMRVPDRIVTVSVASVKNTQCLNIDLNIKEWTLKYSIGKNESCDSISGKHITLVETSLLKKLPNVFLMPFPEAFYIQTVANNIKVNLNINLLLFTGLWGR